MKSGLYKKASIFAMFCIALCLASTLLGCRRKPQPQPTPTPRPGVPAPGIPKDNNPKYNMGAPLLPNAQLTPGDVLDVTPQDFCVSGYSKKVRNVPSSVKRKVYLSYGIKTRVRGEYEVDHLISLQLGGSNSIKNLWPQSYFTPQWNARKKDALENELRREICNGNLDYKTAQREIASNWIAAYKKYMKDAPQAMFKQADPADTETTSTLAPPIGTTKVKTPNIIEEAAPSNEKVWVNLNSGKYFRPGDRYYGKTKSGKYLSEAEARQAGYVEANR